VRAARTPLDVPRDRFEACSRDAQDAHGSRSCLEQRVDERRHCAALREHDERPENSQHDQDGEQPVLFPHPHEEPQLAKKGDHGSDQPGQLAGQPMADLRGPLWRIVLEVVKIAIGEVQLGCEVEADHVPLRTGLQRGRVDAGEP